MSEKRLDIRTRHLDGSAKQNVKSFTGKESLECKAIGIKTKLI